VFELLLQAEQAMNLGRLDEADRLYRQVVDNDPKSSIAVVGLARVALERGDELGAYHHGRRALEIDPDNPVARHLVMRMTEILAGRGEAPPGSVPAGVEPPPAAQPLAAEPASGPAPTTTPRPAKPPQPAKSSRRGLFGRLLGRKRRS
jgi:tetratricopeptide (TPR) repeat protein